MVSYADLVTLLLTLFVVLLGATRANQARLQEPLAQEQQGQELQAQELQQQEPELQEQEPEPTEARGGRSLLEGQGGLLPDARDTTQPEGDDLAALEARIAAFVSLEGLEGQVQTRTEQRGLVVTLVEAGFFDAGQAQPRADALPAIDALARILSGTEQHVRVEGHTDDTPIRTSQFPSNWELSTARATWLVAHLVERFGMDPERLSAAGYGEFRPVASNATVVGRAMNRRVDVVFLSARVVRAEEPVASATSFVSRAAENR